MFLEIFTDFYEMQIHLIIRLSGEGLDGTRSANKYVGYV